MAACTHAVATADTTISPTDSGAFTPALDELLFFFVSSTNTAALTATLIGSTGMTFTQFARIPRAADGDHLYGFVADALVTSAVSQTVQFDVAADPDTGCVIMGVRVAGMANAGLAAIRQIGSQGNQNADVAPAPVFSAAALTHNPTLGCVSCVQNPAAITPPVGWTEGADSGHATPDNGVEYCFRDSGFTGTTITWGTAITPSWCSLIVELDSPSPAAPPTFDTSPTVTSQTDTAYTLGYEASSDADDIFVGAYLRGATAPTAAELKAGTGALATATEATTGAADSIVLTVTESPAFPIYDLYAVLENEEGFSSVVALTNEALDPAAGFQHVTVNVPWAVGAGSVLDGASPVAVDDDVIRCSSVTSPGGYALTMDPDGTFSFDPGADLSRQSLVSHFYDVSVGDYSDSSPVTHYVNNVAPVFTAVDTEYLLEKDVEIEEVVLSSLWSDQENDALTIAFQDALPFDLSVTDGVLSGTPSSSGIAISTLRATDITGEFTEQEITFSIGLRLPDVVGAASVELATAELQIEGPFLTVAVGGSEHSETLAEGGIISMDPVADSLVDYDAVVTLVVSLGAVPVQPIWTVLEQPSGSGVWTES